MNLNVPQKAVVAMPSRKSDSSPTGKRPKPLGQHQSSWIWGRHLVQETLENSSWPILELWLAEDLDRAEALHAERLAAAKSIPVHKTARKSLVSKCRGEDHQGFAAKMGEFPYQTLEQVWRSLTNATAGRDRESLHPFFVVLDGIQDPYNFGTMLRSAEIFGAQAILIGTVGQTGVTSQVARSSVGAVNRLPIIQVNDLPDAVQQLKKRNVQIVGASEKAEHSIWQCNLRLPTAVVIGNEARGMSPALMASCDTLVRIPQQGTINSLNAAAALTIFCYEIRRQHAE